MSSPKPKNTQKPRQPKRKTTKVPRPSESTNIAAYEAIHKEMGDGMLKATTTDFSLEAKQNSGDGPRRQDTMGDTSAHTRVISSSADEALDKEDTSKHRRIDEIDANEDITLVKTHDDVSTQDTIVQDKGIEDVGEEEVVEVVTTAKMIVDTAQVTTSIYDILVSAAETIVTTAPTITIQSTKTNVEVTQAPKRKGVMIQEPKETTTKNSFFTITSCSRQNDEEKRNKPSTKAQQRSIMSTYLKNMDVRKIKALKNKSFAEIQELFDKAMKRINNFVNFRTELVEESIKKDEAETTQESSSKRK
nr:hypothetical protein [Tanacetum cinerariifolium]